MDCLSELLLDTDLGGMYSPLILWARHGKGRHLPMFPEPGVLLVGSMSESLEGLKFITKGLGPTFRPSRSDSLG